MSSMSVIPVCDAVDVMVLLARRTRRGAPLAYCWWCHYPYVDIDGLAYCYSCSVYLCLSSSKSFVQFGDGVRPCKTILFDLLLSV